MLPIFREPHVFLGDIGEGIQECDQSIIPKTEGRYFLKKVKQDCQYTENSIVSNDNRLMPFGIFANVWHFGFVAEFTVPESAVMGADIADGVQGEEPGTHHFIRNRVFIGDLFLKVGGDAPEHRQYFPEAHDFGHHPDWQIRVGITVFFPEVSYKWLF